MNGERNPKREVKLQGDFPFFFLLGKFLGSFRRSFSRGSFPNLRGDAELVAASDAAFS